MKQGFRNRQSFTDSCDLHQTWDKSWSPCFGPSRPAIKRGPECENWRRASVPTIHRSDHIELQSKMLGSVSHNIEWINLPWLPSTSLVRLEKHRASKWLTASGLVPAVSAETLLPLINDFASLYLANSFPKLANSFPKLANSFKQFPCVLYMQMQAPGCAKRNSIRGTEQRQLRMWPTHPWETLQNAGPSSDFGWGRGWSPKIKIYIIYN